MRWLFRGAMGGRSVRLSRQSSPKITRNPCPRRKVNAVDRRLADGEDCLGNPVVTLALPHSTIEEEFNNVQRPPPHFPFPGFSRRPCRAAGAEHSSWRLPRRFAPGRHALPLRAPPFSSEHPCPRRPLLPILRSGRRRLPPPGGAP